MTDLIAPYGGELKELYLIDSLAAAGTALIEAANDAGGKDNISLILVRAAGGPPSAMRSWWPFRR